MRKNKTNKILLIIAAVSLVFSITGCSSSTSSNTKNEKLELTKGNVQKVFANQYEVGINSILAENKSISGVFISKIDIPKNKAKETLKEIENTLHKNFDVSNDNLIEISRNGHTIIKNDSGKIQMGEAPLIEIQEPLDFHKYSSASKFNLLNPAKNVQVTAKDNEDGDITNKIKLKNNDVLTKIGEQKLIYEVTDSDGNIETNNDLKLEITK